MDLNTEVLALQADEIKCIEAPYEIAYKLHDDALSQILSYPCVQAMLLCSGEAP